MPKSGYVIGYDYGLKTIGVAVGQIITATATPLDPLTAKDGQPNWQQLQQQLQEWQPQLAVVGQPLNMDGSESEMSRRAKKFANRLHGRFGLAVTLVDERLSSFEAKGQILAEKHSNDFKRYQIDSLAAKIILEGWFRLQN